MPSASVERVLGQAGPNPSGLCLCGCGQKTPLATYTDRRDQLVKGRPRRYIAGHHMRPWVARPSFPIYHWPEGDALLPVRHHDRVVAYAVVDLVDAAAMGRYHWSLHPLPTGGVVVCRRETVSPGRTRVVFLSREIMGQGRGDPGEVDHRNGDGFDNRRSNLRVVTHAQNGQNRRGPQQNSTTGVRGVSYCKQTGRWKARAEMDGRYYWLGRHPTLAEAEAVVVAWRRENMPISVAS